MKRSGTLVDTFAVRLPPSVERFRELMAAKARLAHLRAALRYPTAEVAAASRAVHDARAAWYATHGGAS